LKTDVNFEFEIRDDGFGVEEEVKMHFDIFLYCTFKRCVLDTTGSGLARICERNIKNLEEILNTKKNHIRQSISLK
jgi:hypothetical protein